MYSHHRDPSGVNAMQSVSRLAMALTLALALAALACNNEAAVDSGSADADGYGPLPKFSLPTLEGDTVSNADIDGQVALVNFWATWCGPCKIEMPWFVDFQQKYKDRGFTVLAISLDEEGWAPVREFAEEMGLNFPVLLGDEPVSDAFGGIHVLPTTLIVSRSGLIVSHHRGLSPKATYESEIEALL